MKKYIAFLLASIFCICVLVSCDITPEKAPGESVFERESKASSSESSDVSDETSEKETITVENVLYNTEKIPDNVDLGITRYAFEPLHNIPVPYVPDEDLAKTWYYIALNDTSIINDERFVEDSDSPFITGDLEEHLSAYETHEERDKILWERYALMLPGADITMLRGLPTYKTVGYMRADLFKEIDDSDITAQYVWMPELGDNECWSNFYYINEAEYELAQELKRLQDEKVKNEN